MWDVGIAQLGPLAALTVFILWTMRQVVQGKLIPRTTYDDRMSDMKAIIRRQQETIDLQAETNRELVVAGRITAELLTELRGRSGHAQSGG